MKRVRRKPRKDLAVICVRVSDSELEAIRDLMRITQKSASSLMREALSSFVALSLRTEAAQ
jgi:hypothetical protein